MPHRIAAVAMLVAVVGCHALPPVAASAPVPLEGAAGLVRWSGGSNGAAVLLVPELGVAARAMVEPARSVGRCLAGRGLAVYALEIDWASPEGSFDALVGRTVPAALAAIGTGRPIAVVGWGLGGVAAYALAAAGRPAPAAVVGLGAPWAFVAPAPVLDSALTALRVEDGRARVGPWLAMVVAGGERRLADVLLAGGEPSADLDPFLASWVSDVGRRWGDDLARFVAAGAAVPADGGAGWGSLPASPTPVLALAGRRDRLAPPELVVGMRTASPLSHAEVLSRIERDELDYGHLDLVLGEAARDEVCERVVDFLAAAGVRP